MSDSPAIAFCGDTRRYCRRGDKSVTSPGPAPRRVPSVTHCQEASNESASKLLQKQSCGTTALGCAAFCERNLFQPVAEHQRNIDEAQAAVPVPLKTGRASLNSLAAPQNEAKRQRHRLRE